MQTPTPTPAYLVACHAGAAARALEASYRAQIAELERHGRDVLRRFSPAQLAAALYASTYVSQLDGRLGSLDLDALEDLAALILRLEHDDEQARAVA
jgi:hypothetical protein